jgi:hypothetical protein
MKASVTACHCLVDCAPCHRYTADPERHCVCTECGHTAACHPRPLTAPPDMANMAT